MRGMLGWGLEPGLEPAGLGSGAAGDRQGIGQNACCSRVCRLWLEGLGIADLEPAGLGLGLPRGKSPRCPAAGGAPAAGQTVADLLPGGAL
jgi:hypothetical protein